MKEHAGLGRMREGSALDPKPISTLAKPSARGILNGAAASLAALSPLMTIFYIRNFSPRIPELYKAIGPLKSKWNRINVACKPPAHVLTLIELCKIVVHQ